MIYSAKTTGNGGYMGKVVGIVNKPLIFNEDQTIEYITQELNYWLEKMISQKPGQWIWSHDRWK